MVEHEGAERPLELIQLAAGEQERTLLGALLAGLGLLVSAPLVVLLFVRHGASTTSWLVIVTGLACSALLWAYGRGSVAAPVEVAVDAVHRHARRGRVRLVSRDRVMAVRELRADGPGAGDVGWGLRFDPAGVILNERDLPCPPQQFLDALEAKGWPTPS